MTNAAYADQVRAGIAAAQGGERTRAQEIARGLFAANPNDPNAYQVLGLAAAVAGLRAEALENYLKADALAPNQPPFLNMIGVLYKQLGDLARACDYLERAVRVAPNFTEAHYNLAAALAARDDREGARRHFEKAIATNPRHAEALARYAHFLEREHEIDKARAMAERALAAAPQNAVAQLTLAEIEAREEEHAAVAERLSAVAPAARMDPQTASMVYGRLAKSLERLERFDEAFEAFARANALQKTFYADFVARQNTARSPENLARLAAFLQATSTHEWTRHDALEEPEPVFLVGFPRSGTTMLDQILTSHPGAQVIEEKETLEDAIAEFLLGRRLDRLPDLSAEEINRFRAAYWKRLNAEAAGEGGLVIDKLPLNAALMGFIHRFFPHAKFILALRDPRDAVLSAFQQTFSMNEAMYQFLDLESAAQYYDRVMGLGARAREMFPLNVHEVRYERVIADFDDEIAPLLSFLGLDWRDEVRRFYETARRRVIKTPSAKQVIKKPYASSIGKWRNYERRMAPALPLLNAWAERFGYPV